MNQGKSDELGVEDSSHFDNESDLDPERISVVTSVIVFPSHEVEWIAYISVIQIINLLGPRPSCRSERRICSGQGKRNPHYAFFVCLERIGSGERR